MTIPFSKATTLMIHGFGGSSFSASSISLEITGTKQFGRGAGCLGDNCSSLESIPETKNDCLYIKSLQLVRQWSSDWWRSMFNYL